MGDVLYTSETPGFSDVEEEKYVHDCDEKGCFDEFDESYDDDEFDEPIDCCELNQVRYEAVEWVKEDDGTRLGRNEAGGILAIAAASARVGSPAYHTITPQMIGRALNRAGYTGEDLKKIAEGYQDEESRPWR